MHIVSGGQGCGATPARARIQASVRQRGKVDSMSMSHVQAGGQATKHGMLTAQVVVRREERRENEILREDCDDIGSVLVRVGLYHLTRERKEMAEEIYVYKKITRFLRARYDTSRSRFRLGLCRLSSGERSECRGRTRSIVSVFTTCDTIVGDITSYKSRIWIS